MRLFVDKRDRLFAGGLLLVMAICAAAFTQKWAIAYFAAAIFVAFLLTHVSLLAQRAFASRAWPSVPSQTMEAYVRERRKRNYSLVLRYEYRVDGTEYTGRRLRYPFGISVSLTTLRKDSRELDGRSGLAVHYDPSAPHHCTLRTGLSTLDGIALVVFYSVSVPVLVVLAGLGIAQVL